MNRRTTLTHEFVEFVPDILEDGVIYISVDYATAAHKCFCGCGHPVITPFSPTDWKLVFDGETISLTPSIGNWNFPCQAHYWIKYNRVEWAGQWSRKEIDEGRTRDSEAKQDYFIYAKKPAPETVELPVQQPQPPVQKRGIWRGVADWLSKLVGNTKPKS